jgi:TPR repeat protein
MLMLPILWILGCASTSGSLGPSEQKCIECSLRRHGAAETMPAALARFDSDCRSGNAASCSVLGVMHEHGRGVARDPKRASSLYQQACQQGNPAGCVNLGRLLGSGVGGRRDAEGAALIFEVACHDGVNEGCYQLAQAHYRSGNVSAARTALSQACGAGHAGGCLGLGALYQHGYGVKRDARRASRLYRRACRQGEALACDRIVLQSHGTSLARR